MFRGVVGEFHLKGILITFTTKQKAPPSGGEVDVVVIVIASLL